MEKSRIEESWRPDVRFWSKIDVDTAKFYISQSEARLKETTETYNLTTARTERYLIIVTAMLTGSIGYLFTGNFLYLQATSFFTLFPILISIYFLWKNFSSFTIYTIGDEPKAIFTSEFIDNYEGETQYLNLVTYTMITLQYKIDQNYKINKLRTLNNSNARLALLFVPLSFLLAAIYQFFLGYRLVWSLP